MDDWKMCCDGHVVRFLHALAKKALLMYYEDELSEEDFLIYESNNEVAYCYYQKVDGFDIYAKVVVTEFGETVLETIINIAR